MPASEITQFITQIVTDIAIAQHKGYEIKFEPVIEIWKIGQGENSKFVTISDDTESEPLAWIKAWEQHLTPRYSSDIGQAWQLLEEIPIDQHPHFDNITETGSALIASTIANAYVRHIESQQDERVTT